jgi:Protein of unknown function DUF262
MPSRTSTTVKDVALLFQLHKDGQLMLAPEFQRNSVWPTAAKAYLLDTILSDRPIPTLYFTRSVSAQTGRSAYAVVDGQQRLRAIFDFLEDRFPLSESKGHHFQGKKFSQLGKEDRQRILNYDLPIEELHGYTDTDIRDMFARMNRYVFKLSPQELRHAKEQGQFKRFVETLGRLRFWSSERVFSKLQLRRMRAEEFCAELTILLIEGPQDKKSAIDLYYLQYRDRFPYARAVRGRLRSYLRWIKLAIPDLREHRYRKPTDLYSLIGAMDVVSRRGKQLSKIPPQGAGRQLLRFEEATRRDAPEGDAARYLLAASRQTDNIGPRTTRIDIIASLLRAR